MCTKNSYWQPNFPESIQLWHPLAYANYITVKLSAPRHSSSLLEPLYFVDFPAGHGVQLDCPSESWYSPTGHLMHIESDSLWKKPGPHRAKTRKKLVFSDINTCVFECCWHYDIEKVMWKIFTNLHKPQLLPKISMWPQSTCIKKNLPYQLTTSIWIKQLLPCSRTELAKHWRSNCCTIEIAH